MADETWIQKTSNSRNGAHLSWSKLNFVLGWELGCYRLCLYRTCLPCLSDEAVWNCYFRFANTAGCRDYCVLGSKKVGSASEAQQAPWVSQFIFHYYNKMTEPSADERFITLRVLKAGNSKIKWSLSVSPVMRVLWKDGDAGWLSVVSTIISE